MVIWYREVTIEWWRMLCVWY